MGRRLVFLMGMATFSRVLLVKFRRKFLFLILVSILSLTIFILVHNNINVLSSIPSTSVETNTTITSEDNLITFQDITDTSNAFNISSDDLLVLLHIQKTGGTAFERHLVQDLKLERPCRCNEDKRRCNCPRPNDRKQPKSVADVTWLLSRFSTGWVCGLHPDYSQLTKCLSKLKRLFLMTFLRHPVHRFVSEYRHVQRGATWKAAKSQCRQYDTQLCYASNKTNWSDVTLDGFLSCSTNMAINRQTRMLASFSELSTCNDSRASNEALLESAKAVLRKLPFIGICEQQRKSQIIFEKTLHLEFKEDFKQSEDNKTRVFISQLPKQTISRIENLNNLDIKLYDYALDLLRDRYDLLINK